MSKACKLSLSFSPSLNLSLEDLRSPFKFFSIPSLNNSKSI